MRVKRERLEWDGDFGCPALAIQPGRTVPDALPVPVDLSDIAIQTLSTNAVRVQVKNVAGAALVKRVKHDFQAIVAARKVSLAQYSCDHLVRFAVQELRANINSVIAVDDVEAGFLGRFAKLIRAHFMHVVNDCRQLPKRLVEMSIDCRRCIRSYCAK